MKDRVDALKPGSMLKHYRIERELGSGGFGITYLAHDTELDTKVAIKELLPLELAVRDGHGDRVRSRTLGTADFDWAKKRFVEEAVTLAKFRQHPHIVSVLEHFVMNGTAYMVTSYEDCQTLGDWLQDFGRRRTTPDEACLRRVFAPLLDALEEIHADYFLHRDLKPSNILIASKKERPFLIDFGSARQAIYGRTMEMTTVVTPCYAPHELYQSDGNQGPWSDIYSMGAVLHFAIRGELLPDALTRISRSRVDPYVPLVQTHRGKFPDALLSAIDHAVAVEEADRPQSIQEWRSELGWDREAAAVPEPPLPPVKVRSTGRWIALVVILVLAAVLTALIYPRLRFGVSSVNHLAEAREHVAKERIGAALLSFREGPPWSRRGDP